MSEQSHKVQPERFTYKWDRAGLVGSDATALADKDRALKQDVYSTLLMALPANSTSAIEGVPGHALSNKEAPVELRLPKHATFADAGVDDVLAVAVKLGANNKLYLLVAPFPLFQGANAVKETDLQLVKLETVLELKKVVNHDGNALLTTTNKFLGTLNMFKRFQLTTVAKVHLWPTQGTAFGRWKMLGQLLEVGLKKQAVIDAGGATARKTVGQQPRGDSQVRLRGRPQPFRPHVNTYVLSEVCAGVGGEGVCGEVPTTQSVGVGPIIGKCKPPSIYGMHRS